MPLNSHFEYDLFISYARLDNRDGLIDDIHKKLKNEINRLAANNLEGTFKIWRDTDSLDNHDFTDEIKRAIKSSALFLIVNSTNFQKSKYSEENEISTIEESLANVSHNYKLGNRNRTFVLQINEADSKDNIHGGEGNTLYKLYLDDTNNYPSGNTWNYDAAITKIAEDMERVIGKINEVSLTAKTCNLFVSNAHKRLKDQRAYLIRQLNYNVFSSDILRIEIEKEIPKTEPVKFTDHSNQLKKYRNEALQNEENNIIIHLLFRDPATEVEDVNGNLYADQLQYEFFKSLNTKNRIVWIQKKAKDAIDKYLKGDYDENPVSDWDAKHIEFLKEVISDYYDYQSSKGNSDIQVRWIITGLDELNELAKTAKEILDNIVCSGTNDVQPENPNEGLIVCLNSRFEDSIELSELAQRLEDDPLIEAKPTWKSEHASAKTSSERFRSRLRQSDKLVLILNRDEEIGWLKARLDEASKEIAFHGKTNEIIIYSRSSFVLSEMKHYIENSEDTLRDNISCINSEDTDLYSYLNGQEA